MKSTYEVDTTLKAETKVIDIHTRDDYYNMTQVAELTKWKINNIKIEMDNGNLKTKMIGRTRYTTLAWIKEWSNINK